MSSMQGKDLHALANDYLNSDKNDKNLSYIIALLEHPSDKNPNLGTVLHTLEVVFKQLFKRGNFRLTENTANTHYQQTWQHLLSIVKNGRSAHAVLALRTCMKLLMTEGKCETSESSAKTKQNFQALLTHLVCEEQNKSALIHHFGEYGKYLDLVFFSWQHLLTMGTAQSFSNEVWALNYLELIHVMPITQDLTESAMLLFTENTDTAARYDYGKLRQFINRVWKRVMSWSRAMSEPVHKQVLIVLLERIMPHLQKPMLLTDFLMDSLEIGGVISLLALQGVFTLIQKHNITYPGVYEKLYALFEPEIFGTKYKARLFFLADIFLSSTHLPETLVAGFVKRLARLSLTAPPQDILIIIYFIGNLILRHAGLRKLIRADTALEVDRDPYDMEELKPEKSQAIESSLWEIIMLQNHVLPHISSAARLFVQNPPTTEWNLSAVLELDENDIFEEELAKKFKQFALNYERPQTLFLPKDDKVQQYWELF